VADVAGDESEVLREGSGGNEQIRVRNQMALLSKHRAHPRKVLDDRIGERQDGEIAQKVT
jgi:hypothetical protein